MTPSSVFIKIVEQIKVSMSAPGEAEISTEETSPSTRASSATSRSSTTTPRTTATETADQILIRLGTVYAPILRFLWAAEKIPNDIPPPTSSPLQDEDTLEWEAQTRKSIFPPTQTFDLNNSSQSSSPQLHDGAMTALTKLSMSIVKQQEAAFKNQEEKADTRLKSWRRLPKIQQNGILLGGIDENSNIPTEPTEEMLSILGCQNGAQVDQYLRQSMSGHNMQIEPGLCSAINKGIIVHPDDASTLKISLLF